jgi:hypothetical protein
VPLRVCLPGTTGARAARPAEARQRCTTDRAGSPGCRRAASRPERQSPSRPVAGTHLTAQSPDPSAGGATPALPSAVPPVQLPSAAPPVHSPGCAARALPRLCRPCTPSAAPPVHSRGCAARAAPLGCAARALPRLRRPCSSARLRRPCTPAAVPPVQLPSAAPPVRLPPCAPPSEPTPPSAHAASVPVGAALAERGGWWRGRLRGCVRRALPAEPLARLSVGTWPAQPPQPPDAAANPAHALVELAIEPLAAATAELAAGRATPPVAGLGPARPDSGRRTSQREAGEESSELAAAGWASGQVTVDGRSGHAGRLARAAAGQAGALAELAIERVAAATTELAAERATPPVADSARLGQQDESAGSRREASERASGRRMGERARRHAGTRASEQATVDGQSGHADTRPVDGRSGHAGSRAGLASS